MSSSSVPLRIPRIAALSLTFALSVIASSAGLNSLIKSRQSQSSLASKVPPPTVIEIDISDVRRTGIIATVVCLLSALLSFAFIVIIALPLNYRSTSTPLSTRTLRLQWLLLAFLAVFLFAVQVPFTLFFATRSASIRAFVGNLELPQSVIQTVQSQLGVSSVYKDIDYLRLTAVFPWLAFGSLLVSIAVTIAAIYRARAPASFAQDAPGSTMSEKQHGIEKSEAAEEELQERV
ncbi:hypothetical protein ONZ45_g19258 [Pleurotus djamor]|nr:hypothetical protein ONZ45_g19258 [Pleurotus djamor]